MTEAIPLHAQVVGDGEPLVILHGLFGSARNWGVIARRLAGLRQVHALDARNHGASPWAETMTYTEMAGDLAGYIEAHALAPCDILGHSMGGKTAMTLALTHPGLVRRLIVADIAPVRYVHGAQDAYGSYIEAMLGLDLAIIKRRSEADAALASSIPEPSLRAFLVQNLQDGGGGFHWRINLRGIEENLENLTDFPVAGGHFDGPTTFLTGELSNYVRPRDEPAIRRLFPAARMIEIGDAGHWPHAEQPERFLRLVTAALQEPAPEEQEWAPEES